jgi:predicted permease
LGFQGAVLNKPSNKTKAESAVIHNTDPWLIGHKTTVLFLVPIFTVLSALLTGISITRSGSTPSPLLSDDNFFSNLSQTVLSLVSLYCMTIPLLRSRDLPLPLFWFQVCVFVSAVAGIASAVVYPFQWQVSGVLGFESGIAQVVATVQLIEGVNDALR